MTTLRTLRKLLFGETWLLPLGVAAAAAVTGVVLRSGGAPARLGGFVLLAGVLVVLLLSVARSARPRAGGPARSRNDVPAPRAPAPPPIDALPGRVPNA